MQRYAPYLAASLLLLLGCKSEPPKPLVKEALHETSATVVAIDPANRLVEMQGSHGTETIVAGPEVKNFDQIHVGDKVSVSYYAGVAAELSKSGEKAGTVQGATEVYRAPAGAKPAGVVGRTVTTTVTIESVDTSFDTVTFKRADGFVRTLAVESPEGKTFIRALHRGDVVDVTYTEALAVAVTPGK